MSIRLIVAFSMGALVAGTCVAGEDKESTILSIEPKAVIETAYLFGSLHERFYKNCRGLNLSSWFTSKATIDECSDLIRGIHTTYRYLSPETVLKKDELLEVGTPFSAFGINDYDAANTARKIVAAKHNLKEIPYKLFLDNRGEPKLYMTKDGIDILVQEQQ